MSSNVNRYLPFSTRLIWIWPSRLGLGAALLRGPLHCAHYMRKPRGGPPDLREAFEVRFSLCCGHEGCRRRVLPPSVRFWDRKVYCGRAVGCRPALAEGGMHRGLPKCLGRKIPHFSNPFFLMYPIIHIKFSIYGVPFRPFHHMLTA
jgi:hypothetical protein